MKTTQSSGIRPVHQSVAGNIQFQTGGPSIEIGFTDQRLSPHAGTATFWTFLRQSGWIQLLKRCLPHPLPKSNNALTPVSKVLGFVQGLPHEPKDAAIVRAMVALAHSLSLRCLARLISAAVW